MIRREKFITRAMVRAEPAWLFVFGDNLQRVGLGGQAREMRGEPNAVGIPTKKAPSMREDAFLNDSEEDVRAFARASYPDMLRLARQSDAGGIIVLPADGIGTGLADLERRAPQIWEMIQSSFSLFERQGS